MQVHMVVRVHMIQGQPGLRKCLKLRANLRLQLPPHSWSKEKVQTGADETGGKLTADAMDLVEAQITRLPLLGKWCVDIGPAPPSLWAS